MNTLQNTLNFKMTDKTHVIKLNIEPSDTLPCCTLGDESNLYFWSDNCKDFVTLYFDHLLPYNLLLGYGLDSEFESDKEELNFLNVIAYLLQYLNYEKEKQGLNKLKELYFEYYNKDIDYLTFVKFNQTLESILKIVRLDLIVEEFYSPFECRHLTLDNENFDLNNLESNFKSYKDFSFLLEY